jgi:hypothetical protein
LANDPLDLKAERVVSVRQHVRHSSAVYVFMALANA